MECNLAKVCLLKNGKVILPEIFIAKTVWQRSRGLLARKPLKEYQGLLIKKCNSVHMIGMTYAIDLCYLDSNGVVVKTVNSLKPWRFSACREASEVIELPVGTIASKNLFEGCKIEWSN